MSGERGACAAVAGRACGWAHGAPGTRPGRPRPRVRGLCAQAGPAGPGWGFVHSDSVFGPGSTQYFS